MKHLSKSQVSMLLDVCPWAYYQERILGIKPIPNVSPIVGLSLHKAQEFYFGSIIESNTVRTVEEIILVAQNEFNKLFSVPELKYLNLFRKFKLKNDETGRAKIREIKHNEMMKGIYTLLPVWQKITPRYVELGATFKIDDDLVLKVFADLICDFKWEKTKIVEEEVIEIGKRGLPLKPKIVKTEVKTGEFINIGSIDLKVSGKAKTQRTVDTDIALPIAVYAQYLKDGTLPEYAGYINLILNTNKNLEVKSEVKILYTKITSENLLIMIERSKAAQNMINCGIYPPCSATHWKCSEEFCDFFPCKFAVQTKNEEDENDD